MPPTGSGKSLHQQHLTRAFDGAVQAALIMRGEAGVFAREDAALIGHKRAEQVRVLKVQSVHREINLRLRAWCAFFCGAASATAVGFVCVCLARHRIT